MSDYLPYVLVVLFFVQIGVIFITSRSVIQSVFTFFHRHTKSTFFSSWLLALIYLPGTFIHELSHYLTAIALLLPVKELSLLPEVKHTHAEYDGHTRRGYYIKLGHVTFGHRDYLRSALVGVAPFFVGLLLLYFIFAFKLFPTESILLNLAWAYLLFSLTSSMFSSKKDMEGTVIFIPIALLFVSLAIGFKIDIHELLSLPDVTELLLSFNIYLSYGTVINSCIYSLLYVGSRIRSRG